MADTPATEAPKRRTRRTKTDAAGTPAEKKPRAAARTARKTAAQDGTPSPAKARRQAKRAEAADLATTAARKVRRVSKKVGTVSGKAATKVKDSAKSAGITRKGLVAGAAVAAVGVVAGLAATIGRKKIVAASGEIGDKVKEGASLVKAKIDEVRGEEPVKPGGDLA